MHEDGLAGAIYFVPVAAVVLLAPENLPYAENSQRSRHEECPAKAEHERILLRHGAV